MFALLIYLQKEKLQLASRENIFAHTLGAFHLMIQIARITRIILFPFLCQMSNKNRMILVSTCVTKWKASITDKVMK